MSINELYTLTEDQRIDAKERAAALIIRKAGDKPTPEQYRRQPPLKPTRDQYADQNVSRYPAWLTKFIGVVMIILFIAAGMPSLFRLFTAGRDYFLHGIDSTTQAAIVGVSTFLLAEFLIVLSTISARVYFEGRARLVFIVPILMGLAVALVGNWTITQPHDVFGWLETVVPPFAVLFIAYIGEKLILDAIHSRYENEQAFQRALIDWQAQTSEQQRIEETSYLDAVRTWQDTINDPQASPEWLQVYATALKEAIKHVNGSGSGKTKRLDIMQSLNARDWSMLVRREIQADEWYKAVLVDDSDTAQDDNAAVNIEALPAVYTNGNGNGNHQPEGVAVSNGNGFRSS